MAQRYYTPPRRREDREQQSEWVQTRDPATGALYYVNPRTRQSAWHLPGAEDTDESSSSSEEGWPDEWEETADPRTGNRYFINRKTRESSWSLPVRATPAAWPVRESPVRESPVRESPARESPARARTTPQASPASRARAEEATLYAAAAAAVAAAREVERRPAHGGSAIFNQRKDEWEERFDDRTGHAYYVNRISRESVWHRPGIDGQEAGGAQRDDSRRGSNKGKTASSPMSMRSPRGSYTTTVRTPVRDKKEATMLLTPEEDSSELRAQLAELRVMLHEVRDDVRRSSNNTSANDTPSNGARRSNNNNSANSTPSNDVRRSSNNNTPSKDDFITPGTTPARLQQQRGPRPPPSPSAARGSPASKLFHKEEKEEFELCVEDASQTPPKSGVAYVDYQGVTEERRPDEEQGHPADLAERRVLGRGASAEKLQLRRRRHSDKSIVEDAPRRRTLGFLSTLKKPAFFQKRMTSPRTESPTRFKADELSLEHFEVLKPIGEGHFSQVVMVKKVTEPEEGRLFAMKCVSKLKTNELYYDSCVRSERIALEMMRSDFVASLRFAFQTKSGLYTLTDVFEGGSLDSHTSGGVDEKTAKFHAAEILLAIRHIHAHDIVHRDVKLTNVLIDREGHVVLTDFGLCHPNVTVGTQPLKTFCGSVECMAPEILRGTPYGHAVDWWAFGILIYELVTGRTPFWSAAPRETFHMILKEDPPDLTNCSSDLALAVGRLLCKDPTARCGFGVRGASAVMALSFFQVDWHRIETRTLGTPPYVPSAESLIDLEHRAETNALAHESEFEAGARTPKSRRRISRFSYYGDQMPTPLSSQRRTPS